MPIILALYISFTNWSGLTSPTSSAVKWVGLQNYRTLITQPGLYQTDFGTAIRNNFYFVIFTVPLQTIFALWLAVLVNNKFLRGQELFQDRLLFPVDHQLDRHHHDLHLSVPGDRRGQHDPRLGRHQGAELALRRAGHLLVVPQYLRGEQPTRVGAAHGPRDLGLGLAFGPVARDVLHHYPGRVHDLGHVHAFLPGRLWRTLGEELDEASEIDGATGWQRFRQVTLPMLRPALVLVLTLGFISTWQIFDQVFLTASNPTVITPAYFSYQVSFQDSAFGVGAAVAFLLFCLIVFLTVLQRRFIKEDLTK